MSGKPKIFGHLLAEVVRKDLCVGCGACVSVCPVNAIDLEGDKPKLVGQCIACGMCYANCPRAEFDEGEVEERVFGRTRSEEEAELGVHTKLYAVRAKDEGVLARSQNGGAVTALLKQFLAEGGDGVVVTGLDEEGIWVPKPVVASNDEEILEGSGTKYTPSPTLKGVGSAVKEYGKKRIAVVGTPCQMRALRKVESGRFINKEIKDAVDLRIGLFCMETFSYDSLMEYLRNEGVDPAEVDKFEVKNGRFIANKDGGEIFKVKLPKVKELVRPCCHSCGDFASEFADISVGNVGSPDGWSTVVVRTERGAEALRGAERAGGIEIEPVKEGKGGLGLVTRLAKLKKKGAAVASEPSEK
jgi:coenzyme F420 hydrogenase subunit beta